jgi:predicted phosphodiesterase
MNLLDPRIVIVEHEQHYIDVVKKLSVIKEIKSRNASAVQVICEERISDIGTKLRGMEFDILISDVFFQGPDFNGFKVHIASEANRKGACLVAMSALLSINQMSELVNEFGVAGILLKEGQKQKNWDGILRKLISRRFRIFDLVNSNESVTWMHISDLHYEDHENANRRRVEHAFIRDIERQRDAGIMPNMIFITGDIAASGHAEQYKRAADFISRLLDSTGVSRDYLFIVPGNHDVAWNKINPNIKKLCGFKNRNDLAQAMRDTAVIAMLQEPFEAYFEFIKESIGDKNSFTQGASFYYSEENNNIGVAGINSAIGSGIIREGDKTFDKGNLFIGEECIEKTTEKVKNHNIRFVLLHHPLSYLMDFDERDVESILCQRCDILLHGHLHLSEFRDVRALRGQMRVLPVGSIFQSRELVNSYSIGIVDLKKRDGIIRFRRYSDIQQEFVRDLDTTGDLYDGSFNFSLRSGL